MAVAPTQKAKIAATRATFVVASSLTRGMHSVAAMAMYTPPPKARAEVRGDRANLASARRKVKESAKVVVSQRTTARFAKQ